MAVTADPFASAPTTPDEAQTAPAPEAPAAPADKAVGSVTVDVVPRLQAVQTEGKVVVTFKGGSGFDAPWIVLHAAGLDEVADFMSVENAPRLMEIMERVQNVGAHFVSKAPARPANAGSAAPQRGAAPQGATEAPSWAPPKPYDDAVYKTGVSKKTGKPWHAWMPPQQGDPREPKFFYQN